MAFAPKVTNLPSILASVASNAVLISPTPLEAATTASVGTRAGVILAIGVPANACAGDPAAILLEGKAQLEVFVAVSVALTSD